MTAFGTKLSAKTLLAGEATGDIAVLDEPLSFWGGFDVAKGKIVDQNHPQVNKILSNKILVMPSGRGSSSASSILAESLRRKTGPLAVVLKEADAILVLGAMVAKELYAVGCPVVQVNENDWEDLRKCKSLSVIASENGEAELQLSFEP